VNRGGSWNRLTNDTKTTKVIQVGAAVLAEVRDIGQEHAHGAYDTLHLGLFRLGQRAHSGKARTLTSLNQTTSPGP
jgi:hypothetical protein